MAERIPAVEDHFQDAVRMANGVRDGERGTLRDTQQRVGSQIQSVHDRLQILQQGFEGNVLDVPVGKPVVPAVVANEAVAVGEEVQQRRADGALPVILDMRHSVADPHHRLALADTATARLTPSLVRQNVIS